MLTRVVFYRRPIFSTWWTSPAYHLSYIYIYSSALFSHFRFLYYLLYPTRRVPIIISACRGNNYHKHTNNSKNETHNMFNNDQQQQQHSPPRRNQPPHQQNQRQFDSGQGGGQNNYQQHPNYNQDDYYNQFPSPPRVGGRRSSSQPQQQGHLGQQNTTNLSGEYSWMNSNRTISRPTISRLTGPAGGDSGDGIIGSAGSILPPPPPPGLGQGIGSGTSMSLPENLPTINSTFPRGAGGSNPWTGGGGAFGAPRATSGGSLHSGGPYRGPTPPTPGSSLGQPSYHQQGQQDYEYSGGNAFAAPHYPPQSMVETSPHRTRRQPYEQEPEPPRRALPSSFIPTPPTSRAFRQQSAGASSNVVEVQEVPTSYDQSPYDFGGEEDMLPPLCVSSYNQHLGYQHPSQYQQVHVGPMGSIGEYNSNQPSGVQYPSSPSHRSLSRNSNQSQRSSNTPSPTRGGRGRGGGGRGRGRGGRGGRCGRGSRPSSQTSQGSYNDRPPSSVTFELSGRNSATIRSPSPASSELEVVNQSPSPRRPNSARSDGSLGSQSPHGRSSSARSNSSSRGSQSPHRRPGSARSNGSNGSGGRRRVRMFSF